MADCIDADTKLVPSWLVSTRDAPHHTDVDAAIYPPDERVLKRVEHHAAAVALSFMFYNFGRVHQTLRVAPAMEAGIADWITSGRLKKSSACWRHDDEEAGGN